MSLVRIASSFSTSVKSPFTVVRSANRCLLRLTDVVYMWNIPTLSSDVLYSCSIHWPEHTHCAFSFYAMPFAMQGCVYFLSCLSHSVFVFAIIFSSFIHGLSQIWWQYHILAVDGIAQALNIHSILSAMHWFICGTNLRYKSVAYELLVSFKSTFMIVKITTR